MGSFCFRKMLVKFWKSGLTFPKEGVKVQDMDAETGVENFKAVVYRRKHGCWAPALLLGDTAGGGAWLLSFDPTRRVHRIRSGAEVVEIDAKQHEEISSAYQDVQRRIARALLLVGKKGHERSKSPKSVARKIHDAGRASGLAAESS